MRHVHEIRKLKKKPSPPSRVKSRDDLCARDDLCVGQLACVVMEIIRPLDLSLLVRGISLQNVPKMSFGNLIL